MTPNLFLLARKIFYPRCWLSRRRLRRSHRRTADDREDVEPIRSSQSCHSYKYVPGHGWRLVRHHGLVKAGSTETESVIWCQILQRWMPQSELDDRTRRATVMRDDGILVERSFFRFDDGVTWVDCWDSQGKVKPGPWRRWCIDDDDDEPHKMRPMLKRDDPDRKPPTGEATTTDRPHGSGTRHADPVMNPLSSGIAD